MPQRNSQTYEDMIQDTSLNAWMEKLESAGPDEQAVLAEIRREPSTIREIAARLGWEAGRVSARLNALQIPRPGEERKRKLGLVRIALDNQDQQIKAKCRITGKLAYLWEATSPLPPAMKPVEPKPQTLFS